MARELPRQSMDDMVQLGMRVPLRLRRQLRHLATDRGTTMEHEMGQALARYLAEEMRNGRTTRVS